MRSSISLLIVILTLGTFMPVVADDYSAPQIWYIRSKAEASHPLEQVVLSVIRELDGASYVLPEGEKDAQRISGRLVPVKGSSIHRTFRSLPPPRPCEPRTGLIEVDLPTDPTAMRFLLKLFSCEGKRWRSYANPGEFDLPYTGRRNLDRTTGTPEEDALKESVRATIVGISMK